MQGTYGPQPLPYPGIHQVIQPAYPGFNGAPKQTTYNREAALGLGITQMTIGVSCLILNSISISLVRFINVLSFGISGGILIFVAGLLQVLSAKKAENSCLIVGTMVMTAITACASAVILLFSVAFIYQTRSPYLQYDGPLALGVIMAILVIVEALIAIITSAICCNVVCNKLSSVTAIPVYIARNQSNTFQSSNPGTALPPGQTLTQGEPHGILSLTSSFS